MDKVTSHLPIKPGDTVTNPVIRVGNVRPYAIPGEFTVKTVDVVPISDGPDIIQFSLFGQPGAFLWHDQRHVKPKAAFFEPPAGVAGCYKLISRFYGDKRAKRSGVPYMNHIDEGLKILSALDASCAAYNAYCLHPMFQDDAVLSESVGRLTFLSPNQSRYLGERMISVHPRVLLTVMEFRNVANRGLHCYQVDDPERVYLGPLQDVHHMLIADKVQNRKDFMLHHYGTHPKSAELDRYFRNWLRALKVTEQEYDRLVKATHA